MHEIHLQCSRAKEVGRCCNIARCKSTILCHRPRLDPRSLERSLPPPLARSVDTAVRDMFYPPRRSSEDIADYATRLIIALIVLRGSLAAPSPIWIQASSHSLCIRLRTRGNAKNLRSLSHAVTQMISNCFYDSTFINSFPLFSIVCSKSPKSSAVQFAFFLTVSFTLPGKAMYNTSVPL